MSVRQELRDAAYRVGGSFKTRENRTNVCSRFADYLRDQNIHITRLSHIKTAYVEAYIRSGLERGLKARTLQSELRAYEAAGYSHHEALAMTSLDLGHGDGRGRWVKTVYSL